MVPSHGFSPRSYFFDNPRRYDSDDDLAWNAAPQGLQGRYTPVPTGPGQGVGPYQWAEPGPQVFAGAGGEAGRRPAPRVCARPTAATQRRLSGVGSRASPRSSAGHPRGAGCPGRPPLAATRWHSALPRSGPGPAQPGSRTPAWGELVVDRRPPGAVRVPQGPVPPLGGTLQGTRFLDVKPISGGALRGWRRVMGHWHVTVPHPHPGGDEKGVEVRRGPSEL